MQRGLLQSQNTTQNVTGATPSTIPPGAEVVKPQTAHPSAICCIEVEDSFSLIRPLRQKHQQLGC